MSNIQSEHEPDNEHEDLTDEKAPLGNAKRARRFMDLLRNSRGSGTIEKVFMIALFIFVAALGLQKLGAMTQSALNSQSSEISKYGKAKVGGTAPGAGS